MKITNLKALVAKVATVGLLAGAVVLAAPGRADAQVRLGVTFGAPVVYSHRYYAPPPVVYRAPAYGYGYYGPRFRHEEYDRYHREDYDRDHREFRGYR